MSSPSSPSSRHLVFVTGNAGKFTEVRAYLPASWHVERVALDVDEVQAATAQEVSHAKAVAAFRALRGRTPVLVDDTSLELDALCGLPGPYVKWFLLRLGAAGLARMTDGFASTHVDDVSGDGSDDVPAHRRATARCVFSYCERADAATAATTATATASIDGDVRVVQFVGVCRGAVVAVPRGDNGLGWDSVFVPDEQPPCADNSNGDSSNTKACNATTSSPGARRTFAEMSMAEKATMSHRARALDALRAYFDSA